MSSRTLDLFCVLGQQRCVRSLSDPQPVTLRLYEGNTYALRLNAIVATGSGLKPFAATQFSEFATFEAALGVLDAAPTAGKWKLKVTGETQTTADQNWNVSTANLQTALNAPTAVTSGGGVTVSAGNTANVFIIRAVNAATDFTFEAASNQLVPSSVVRIRKATDGGGVYTMVKIRQGYLSYVDGFTFPDPPPATVTTQVTGSTVRNCLQLLVIPALAVGVFSLQHDSFSTALLSVDTVTPALVAAALNGLYADGATAPRFACYASGSDDIQIECIGALARSAVPTIGITLYGQAPLQTPVADFQITPLPIELRVSGKDSVDVLFELAGYDSDGNEHTLIRQTATIVNTILTPADAQAFAGTRTKYEEVFTGVDADEAGIIGSISRDKVLTGSGTAPSAGQYTETFTHDLATVTPDVNAWMLLDPSGEGSWREMADTEFDARTAGNPNAVTVKLAATPPTAGHVGSVKITVTKQQAQAYLNEHRHSTDFIDGVGIDDGRTLTQILALLRAAMPDGWPAVPGNSLVAGSVTADKLNLTSLIEALFTPAGTGYAGTLATLREIVKDPGLVTNLVTALTTNTALASTLTTLTTAQLAVLEKLPAFADTLKKTIAADPGLTAFFRELVIATLQSGTALADAVLMAVPDFEFTYPNPELANGELPNGDEDGFFPLPSAIHTSLVNDGNISGRLPNATLSLKGHYRTVDGAAHTLFRDFTNGQIVYCTGYDWFPAALVANRIFTTDLDEQLFTIAVNERMLSTGTRFSVLAGVTLQQEGNCEGRWLMRLERCTAGAELVTIALTGCSFSSGGTTVTCASTTGLLAGFSVTGTGIPVGARVLGITNSTHFTITLPTTQAGSALALSAVSPGNISTLTVNDVIFELPLEIDATAVTHNIGFAVSRTGDAVFSATKTLYTATTAAVAPTQVPFVLRCTLSRYDSENVVGPRGKVSGTMKGVRASIVKIT